MPIFIPSNNFIKYINEKDIKRKYNKNDNNAVIIAVKKINKNDINKNIGKILENLLKEGIVDDVYIKNGNKAFIYDNIKINKFSDEYKINKEILLLSKSMESLIEYIKVYKINDEIIDKLEEIILYLINIKSKLQEIRKKKGIKMYTLHSLIINIKLLINELEKIKSNYS